MTPLQMFAPKIRLAKSVRGALGRIDGGTVVTLQHMAAVCRVVIKARQAADHRAANHHLTQHYSRAHQTARRHRLRSPRRRVDGVIKPHRWQTGSDYRQSQRSHRKQGIGQEARLSGRKVESLAARDDRAVARRGQGSTCLSGTADWSLPPSHDCQPRGLGQCQCCGVNRLPCAHRLGRQ